MTAHAIDHRSPTLLRERLAWRGKGRAFQDFGRTKAVQARRLGGPAGYRSDFVSASRKQGDRASADPSPGSGDQHLSAGRHAVPLDGQHAQHCSKPGRADRHRGARVKISGDAHKLFALDARLLRKPAEHAFAITPPGQQHPVAGLPLTGVAALDGAGEINSRDHRKLARNGRATCNRQRILEVQRGPLDAHGRVARVQRILRDFLERGPGDFFFLFEPDRLDHIDHLR